ncbi:MAG: glycosyltransferase family 4 protein [Acidobacteriota bacterium]|nr:glycosyltransferase family 4 protein [Acidobacteriota bacterium]
MLAHIVDPSAYTPPYDHFLCQALARAGADVELYTSRFTYGAVPVAQGYARHEHFYRLAHARRARSPGRRGAAASTPIAQTARSRARIALKLAEHVPDMLRYRRLARPADIVHFQWLTVQPLDIHLLPRQRAAGARVAPPRPRLVLTAHDILPREPRPGQIAGQRRLYGHFDAIVVHSEHGRGRLVAELGVPESRVHVIPHGALTPWEGQAGAGAGGGSASALPAGFGSHAGPVVLFFGLLRPYKGLDVLLDAWRALGAGEAGAGGEDSRTAELWIVGMERMDTGPLREAAPAGVRFLTRFISDAEIGAFLERASLVVLPYRDIDASGAAFRAIGAGVPLLLSDAGGFPEIAESGAARTFPAGDSRALAGALAELLSDGAELARMARLAESAARERYGWKGVAESTLGLYRSLLGENDGR